MSKQSKPFSRKTCIVIQEIDREVLIYDLTMNKVFCLNETSAKVWNSCDGKKSIVEIARHLGFPEEAIWLALDQLDEEKLIENYEGSNSYFRGLSRREVIKKVGLASMIALPLVVSITAPKAANAQSGQCPSPGIGDNSIPNGCDCVDGNDCQTLCCVVINQVPPPICAPVFNCQTAPGP